MLSPSHHLATLVNNLVKVYKFASTAKIRHFAELSNKKFQSGDTMYPSCGITGVFNDDYEIETAHILLHHNPLTFIRTH